MSPSELELLTWQRVAGLAQSPSHDFHHICRVQAYADALGRALNLDSTAVRIAAILHDLGRSDESRRHGLDSIQASKEMAEEILHQLPVQEHERRLILDAIEGHDQPDLHPESPEARILKDADFLAGFGAWGILRIAMWSGETGRRVDDVLGRLTKGMQRRLETLEYSESRDTAMRELIFARQFLGELQRPVTVGSSRRSGLYCVLEGVSGVGKNTLAEGLCRRLEAIGVAPTVVEEPNDAFRKLRDYFPEGSLDSSAPLVKGLLMADRADLVARVITPALERGEVVISVRSYLSTAVYQSTDYAEAYRIMLEYDWVPRCDLLLLLQTDPETAIQRTKVRKKPAGRFETLEQLKQHREKYEQLATLFPCQRVECINADAAIQDVEEQAFKALGPRVEALRARV